MENFVPHIRNRTNDTNTILQELTLRQYYKPQARPPFSANLIRFALHLRYTSCQAYKLLHEKLPLPSLGLLQKISQGNVDSLKALKLLLSKAAVSNDWVVLFDEMYLEKSTQYHSGYFIGQDEKGDLYKSVVVFMLVSLQKSIPYVKSILITSIRGEWLADEIDKCITVLKDIGCFVRAVICDDHSANVKAFRCLMKKYDGDSKLFIYHPSYEGTMKTHLFVDIIHLPSFL